MTTKELNKPGR